MHRTETFLDWLQKLGYDKSGREVTTRLSLRPAKKDTTHYRMDGGKLQIRDSFMTQFLERYADAVSEGDMVSLVERRTPVFKMHFDLDFEDVAEIKKPMVSELLRHIRDAMAPFFPDDADAGAAGDAGRFHAVVLKAPCKTMKSKNDGSPQVKTGFHVIYPNICVDSRIGLTLRHAALLWVRFEMGRRVAPVNSWYDVLDKCVYQANGLRMPYAPKSSICKACTKVRKNRKKTFTEFVSCDACVNRMFIDEGRLYKPYLAMGTDGLADRELLGRLKTDHLYCVMQGSIRCIPKYDRETREDIPVTVTSSFVLPAGVVLEEKEAVNATKDFTEIGSELVRPTASLFGKDAADVPYNSTINGAIEEFIRTAPLMGSFGGSDNPYKDLVVTRVQRKVSAKKNLRTGKAHPPTYFVNVAGPGQNYCHNVKREHNSSSVYFQFTPKGLLQRCFCPKECPENAKVECRKYTSKPIKITDSLRFILFPLSTSMKPTHGGSMSARHRLADLTQRNMLDCIAPGGMQSNNIECKRRHIAERVDTFIEQSKMLKRLTDVSRIDITLDTAFPCVHINKTSAEVDAMDIMSLLALGSGGRNERPPRNGGGREARGGRNEGGREIRRGPPPREGAGREKRRRF
jgi:hypothetical protein